jgi:hypothetical protein
MKLRFSSPPRVALPELDELQRWFAQVLTHPGTIAGGLSAAPQLTAAELIRGGGSSPSARLEVYRHAYRARLLEWLEGDYPALRHALGPAGFRALCLAYIAQHPSSSPSLMRLGARLPAFCAQRDLREAACLADLARLEWAVVKVTHAAEASPLPANALAELSLAEFSRARFEPNPALQLLEQAYPVNAYYAAFLGHRVAKLPSASKTFTVVRRRNGSVLCEELERTRAELLRALLVGKPIASALELGADSGMSEADVSAAFRQFTAHAYFAGLRC